MFTATIGGYNARTQPQYSYEARDWKRDEPKPAPAPKEQVPTSGVRRAGETSSSGKPKDPTWKLEEDILGKK